MIKDKLSKINSGGWLITLLLVYHLVSNIIWAYTDSRPQAWDGSMHLNLSLGYLEAFKNFDLRGFIANSKFYPPFFHLSLIPALLLTNFNSDSVVITNWFYLALLVIFTYKIGKKLFLRTQTAVSSAVLVSFYPIIQHLASREALMDLSLAAFVSAGIYFLLAAGNFSNKRAVLLFFVISFLGMLSKWNYALFLAGPFVHIVLKSDSAGRKKALFGVLAVTAALIPFYGPNFVPMLMKIAHFASIGKKEGDPPVLSPDSLFWYFLALGAQMYFIPMVFFVFGAFYCALKKVRNTLPLLLWIAVPYVVMSFVSNKDARYTAAYLSACALITAAPFGALKGRAAGIAGISLLAVAFLQSVHINFNINFLPKNGFFSVLKQPIMLFSSDPARNEDWKFSDIFEYISANRNPLEPHCVVSVVSNHPYFHSANLRFFARTRYTGIAVKGYKKRLGEFAEFILYKTNERGPAFTLGEIEKAAEEIQKPNSVFNADFIECFRANLPDGSEAVLYKKSKVEYSLKSFKLHFEQLNYGKTRAYNADLFFNLEVAGDAGISVIEMRAGKMEYKGFTINNPRIIFRNAVISFSNLIDSSELYFLSLGEIQPHFTIPKVDLESYISKKLEKAKLIQIGLDSGLNIKAVYGVPVEVRSEVRLIEGGKISAGVSKIKIMGISVPRIFYKTHLAGVYALYPEADKPFNLKINSLIINNDKGIAINE